MKTFRCRDANWHCFVASALLVLLIFSSTSHASDVRQLWQSRDQFVALERKDSPMGGTVIANDHPVEISTERLAAILASIEFRSADSASPEQLITKQSLELLVPEIVQGFRKATSGEDVTFALVGLHSSMLGFGKRPKVTTGRAFYKDGRLNVIFGLVQKDVNEREDRRLAPFTPGSRQKATEGEWTLLPQSGHSGFTLERKDWVTFSEEWRAPVAQIPLDKQNVHSVQTAPVQPGELNNDTRKPGERLTTLNELKAKGLISEEEYRSKRLEILKGL